jgi:anhydro-N-acetylmuramic acid kinase
MVKRLTGIGLMSGTSLDGLDIACCEFIFQEEKINFILHTAETIQYSEEWRERLHSALHVNGRELMLLNHDFGVYCGNAVRQFLNRNSLKVDYVSSHGHTVFHQPQFGFSTQIGSGAAIFANCGLPTVCDFRSVDVAMGGQGAPLVPIGDQYLFSDFQACLNIGGIANISFQHNNKRIAFDVCSANMVLNELAAALGLKMDKGGALAASGILLDDLMKDLNADPFYEIAEKKSLGREWVEQQVIQKIAEYQGSIADKLRTVTEHIATQVSTIILKNNLNRVLVTGGGAYNNFLIDRIRNISTKEIILPKNEIIEFKEALIFAFLGALRIMKKNNSLASVTGASADSCGGCIYG